MKEDARREYLDENGNRHACCTDCYAPFLASYPAPYYGPVGCGAEVLRVLCPNCATAAYGGAPPAERAASYRVVEWPPKPGAPTSNATKRKTPRKATPRKPRALKGYPYLDYAGGVHRNCTSCGFAFGGPSTIDSARGDVRYPADCICRRCETERIRMGSLVGAFAPAPTCSVASSDVEPHASTIAASPEADPLAVDPEYARITRERDSYAKALLDTQELLRGVLAACAAVTVVPDKAVDWDAFCRVVDPAARAIGLDFAELQRQVDERLRRGRK